VNDTGAHEQRFRAFVSATSDVIYRMSPDWGEMHELQGRSFVADTWDPTSTWLEKYIHPDDQSHVMSVIQEAIRTQSIFQLEHRVRRVDGSVGWAFSRAIPLKDESGNIIEWFGTASDVTDRKRNEQVLREREQQLRLATEAADIGLWDVDVIADKLFWPPRVKAMFGISPDVEVSMADFYSGLHPDDRTRTSEAFAAALNPVQRALYDVEYRTVGKEDGLIRWVAAKGRGIFDSTGRCIRVIGTAIDVTTRKLVEERLRDAMTALSDAEKRTRELFLQAPGFMCILRGPEHVFEFANDSYQLLVGHRALLGKPVRAMFQEVEGQGFFELLDKVYRTGEPVTGSETSLQLRRKPDGPLESHFIDFVYQPIKDSAGTVTGIFVEGFDVTSRLSAQRELRRSEDLRQLALDASRMGTFTWFPEQDRSEADARMLELFGITANSKLTLDAALTELIDSEDRARYAQAVAGALDPRGSGGLHEDIRITRPNGGSKHWLAISAQVFFEGEPRRAVRMIGTAADITERKRVEEALRLADVQKDEFLAMLAHELRNPLAPISMASMLLSRTIDRDDRSHFAIETIQRQTRQLTRLVDELLDVSRITRGRIALQRQPLDLASAIAQAVETVEPQLREKQHRISVTTSTYQPLYISGDLTRIVQCVVNILANAAKYTDAGGEIRVQTRSKGSHAIIEVCDTGIGISPVLLPRIFDLFVQGDRTLDRAQGGLGIGLSVAKRLAEMHEGEISARSAGLGHGSTFEIRLPLIARPPARTPEAASITSPPRSVLVVDDNADAANTLAAMLNSMGHKARVAFSGKEALEQLQTFEPEVALLDIGLPAMNGYELAQRLRGNPKLKGVRLVALTGYGQTEDRQRALAEGFEEHLVKPVDLLALERILAASSADR
jgi:PAS domain S-box-containing protein